MRESEQNSAPETGSHPELIQQPVRAGTSTENRMSEERPWTISVAFWIVIAVTAVTLVNLTILLLTFNWAAFSDPTEPRTFVSYGHTQTLPANISLGVTIAGHALVLAIAAALVALALRLRQGGNRARIILTVVCGLEVVGFIASPHVDFSTLILLAEAVFIVTVWLAPSNAFLRRVKADRANREAGR